MQTIQKDVLIVGSGPSGITMGMLLANQGVDTLVLEINGDFHREYRGEMLQPHYLKALKTLNILPILESAPHHKVWSEQYYYKKLLTLNITYKPLMPEQPYAIMMWQPDYLDAMHNYSKEMLPHYDLWFKSRPKQLLWEGDTCVGAIVEREGELVEVRAKIVVGADGRNSSVRKMANIEMEYEYYEKDRIWFTCKQPGCPIDKRWFVHTEKLTFLMLPKAQQDVIQSGFTIQKGEWKEYQKRGIDFFKHELREAGLHHFADELKDFSPFVTLRARIFFAKEWAKNGLLIVGDAAHCASPVGAIGIAASSGTAIYASEVILEGLKKGDLSKQQLDKVQAARGDYVKKVHEIQKRSEFSITTPMNWKKRLTYWGLTLASRTPLIKPYIRKFFFALLEEMPANPALRLPNWQPGSSQEAAASKSELTV